MRLIKFKELGNSFVQLCWQKVACCLGLEIFYDFCKLLLHPNYFHILFFYSDFAFLLLLLKYVFQYILLLGNAFCQPLYKALEFI